MLIASEPILPSTGTGSIKGTLIFGRFLDKDQIEHLSKTTLLNLSFQPIGSASDARRFRGCAARSQPASARMSPIEVPVAGPDTISGYALLKDVYGKPALIIRADMSRAVYNRGQDTLRYFLFALVGFGVVFGLVILLLLKNTVLSRLARLDKVASGIATSGDISARVAVGGSDELSHLASSMKPRNAVRPAKQPRKAPGERRALPGGH